MENSSRFYFLFSLLLLLLTAGCASNDIYRTNYKDCTTNAETTCESHSIQLHNAKQSSEYQLMFIEIDDQGQIRDRQQLKALLDKIYLISAHDNVLINVFVHGWHHNAKPGDSNIEGFKEILNKLSVIENDLSKTNQYNPRKVIGIYVGWRGESIDLPGLRYLSFWERKNTAEDVGYLGIAELLLKLEEVTNVKNTQLPNLKSRLVTIGHSFGGAVVYNATSQILANRFLNSLPGKNYVGPAQGFGDLVVLLNPAFEAIQFSPLYDLAQSRCSYLGSINPRLVILTSETDLATKVAFSAGRFFTTLFETHNTIDRQDCRGKRTLHLDEGSADRTAVGHFGPLLTHTLTPATKANNNPQKGYLPTQISSLWKQYKENQSQIFGNTSLTHLGKTAIHNPYLNIKVSEDIMDGHNDIFGADLMEFIRTLIILSIHD